MALRVTAFPSSRNFSSEAESNLEDDRAQLKLESKSKVRAKVAVRVRERQRCRGMRLGRSGTNNGGH